jgi:hypothetical protein
MPRLSRLLTAFGRTQTAVAWSMETGVDNQLITARCRNGWSDEAAVTPKHITKLGTNTMVAISGRTQTVRDWAREADVSVPLILCRLGRGWDPALVTARLNSLPAVRKPKPLAQMAPPPDGSAMAFWSKLAGMPSQAPTA